MSQQPPQTSSKWITHGVFALGIFSSLAFRAIPVMDHLLASWVRPVWYAGVLGYVIFFFYRYRVSRRRRRTVREFRLIESLEGEEDLSADQRRAARYLLDSLVESREVHNYYAIFILSGVAIALDQVLAHLG